MPHMSAPVIGKLCSLIGLCELNKSGKFKLWLITLVICIVGFQFSTPSMMFYANPFYIGGFVSAIALLINTLNYFCPECQRNEVTLSIKQFRLPSNICHHCGYRFDKKNTK